MSRVALARECRICAWASFTSAPAIFSQVACDLRKQRQLTNPRPIFRAAGLMCRLRVFLSFIRPPCLTRCNTKSPGLLKVVLLQEQPSFQAFEHCARAISHPELGENTGDVILDGSIRRAKGIRDLSITVPARHQPNHFDLARGQRL